MGRQPAVDDPLGHTNRGQVAQPFTPAEAITCRAMAASL
jgi:hypothetical protein